MSCFWNALIAKIPELRQQSPSTIIAFLQAHNSPTPHVRWQGEPLSLRQQKENFQWIRDYNPSNFQNGHDTSICDPFLVLICQLFHTDILLAYLGHPIHFQNVHHSVRAIHFQNSTGHFQ